MAEFEYRTPVIPQFNFKNISSKSYQILESENLNIVKIMVWYPSQNDLRMACDSGCES